jgi:hypothetical protein
LQGSDPFTTSAANCNPRFAPGSNAGTSSNAAGRSAPFILDLSQGAAEPNLTSFSLTLPPGLSADLAQVSTCPEAATATAVCPLDSRLGYARIALGSGPEPLWIPSGTEPDSAVYLAGPYKGAPYSLLISIPAEAGPYHLGTVITRAALSFDPSTAEASVHLDPLPQILHGIPLHYRTIRVVLNRPGFIRNPTSCEPMSIVGTAKSADGSSADLASRFRVTDCAALSFKPKFSLGVSGAIGRNGHPALRAVLRSDPDGAAPASMELALPGDELLDLHHIRALCSRGLAPDRCPPGSRLGSLSLETPFLYAPLTGPVYLRAPGKRLPGLVADLRSDSLHFVLAGHIATDRRLSVGFPSIPDIPLSKAVLSLAGGQRGIVVNSRALCSRPSTVEASLSAHSGKHRRLRVPVRLGGRC